MLKRKRNDPIKPNDSDKQQPQTKKQKSHLDPETEKNTLNKPRYIRIMQPKQYSGGFSNIFYLDTKKNVDYFMLVKTLKKSHISFRVKTYSYEEAHAIVDFDPGIGYSPAYNTVELKDCYFSDKDISEIKDYLKSDKNNKKYEFYHIDDVKPL